MSQVTSGDQMWMDYGHPKNEPGIDRYADDVATATFRAYKTITNYYDHVPVAMVETTLTLQRRIPDAERLTWARSVVTKMGDRAPQSLPEVYAKEAVSLHEEPQRELKLQAIRIGELGITAIPNEVFALSGLRIKAQSPFSTTMNIELANGSEGYIPPPEQHALGGYTTWPARTAALEVQAEPKIVETILSLLERVSGRSRRTAPAVSAPYAEHVLSSAPVAYWRLEEMAGSIAHDATGRENTAKLEDGFAHYLPGPELPGLRREQRISRAIHLAGGRLVSRVAIPAESYSVEFWFWNGLPVVVRPVTAYLIARGDSAVGGDVLGMAGSLGATGPGRLFFTTNRSGAVFLGKSEIAVKSWHHVVLTRTGRRIQVFLDGKDEPEIAGDAESNNGGGFSSLYIGGQTERRDTLEGKIDEIAVYDRPLGATEAKEHYRAATDAGN
jgi:hypothetical protein